MSISIGTGTDEFSGDITLENLTTTGDVSIVNNGNTAGSDILRTSVDALITADTVALDATPTAGTTASIGLTGSPIRMTTTSVDALAQGGGVFLNSPAQGVEVGSADLLALNGVATSNDGDIEITVATGNLTINSEAIAANGAGDV